MSACHSSQRTYDILLVEDSDDDVVLTKYALDKTAAPVRLHVAYDGVDALKFLRRESPHDDAPRPDLILMDLNLPRMDGRQLLIELKQDEVLRVIPTIVLSTSTFQHDVHNAYREHASAYLTKPLYLPDRGDRTKCLIDFWLRDVALLPSSRTSG